MKYASARRMEPRRLEGFWPQIVYKYLNQAAAKIIICEVGPIFVF